MKKYSSLDIIETIINNEPEIRNRTLEELLFPLNRDELIEVANKLDEFRRNTSNLYHRVRSSLILFALYRFYLIGRDDVKKIGYIPYIGVKYALERDFEVSIDVFLNCMRTKGHNEAIYSALADAYQKLAFKYLLDQVHASIEASKGNGVLFNTDSLEKYNLRAHKIFTQKGFQDLYPILFECNAVRMDPSHSGWSDIFFLGMDFPEGARVTNISIDLGIRGRDVQICPPIECYCRMIDEPVIRITSTDIGETKDINNLEELFNFANDHIVLLKAGIVSSGIIPPALSNKNITISIILEKLLEKPGGFELVTKVNGIPKGSRLAVSTSLLACIITCCMRFSGQTKNIEGCLSEEEKRLVASRAILGEWLGGSGGGWQDSGGIWPGIKVITGQLSKIDDPEYGISRGTLLPNHKLIKKEDCAGDINEKLASSIILVHGGMAQNVGPILEMVTEKYLLRLNKEWKARNKGYDIFDNVVQAIKDGDIKRLGQLTTQNWNQCIKPIIPWVTNSFTEEVYNHLLEKFDGDFWGFLMLGGMSGGGMAYIVNPKKKSEILNEIAIIMASTKEKYEDALPFAISPVVYNFEVNNRGITAKIRSNRDALMPDEYYKFMMMNLLMSGKNISKENLKKEIEHFLTEKDISNKSWFNLTATGLKEAYKAVFKTDVEALLSSIKGENPQWEEEAEEIKLENGFDREAHEEMRKEIISGKISVKGNRLPLRAKIEDVNEQDVLFIPKENDDRDEFKREIALGQKALNRGEIAVVTLAAGLGSRWTSGAGVVKTINPFVKIAGSHRSFAEIHLAKTRKACIGRPLIQHVFTTSFLTHKAIKRHLERTNNFNYEGPVYLSKAQAIGQKLYPTERDLRFIWEELPQQVMSENVQKVIDDLHEALITWAKSNGEAQDYKSNIPQQRFYPPGHWYEIPNMLRNGTLAQMLIEQPNLKYLFIHNGDTLGAWLDPLVIGMHINSGKTISFEVTPRRYEDVGGGLAKVDGILRLVEGMALPREEDEYKLRFYNTLTSIVTIESLLKCFNITTGDLITSLDCELVKEKVHNNLRQIERRIPTYATIKEVKLRWGAGQEDIYPIMQCEKLWGDITHLDEIEIQYLSVSRMRGQQLKDPNLLDRWAMDGSKDYIISLTDWAD
ncbi:MAG: UTP--glucose-1-phosphate uridylyltransferase [bacterium]|nr:UTP--glucose-1-phosphate uridylyltransferase [bacterium]